MRKRGVRFLVGLLWATSAVWANEIGRAAQVEESRGAARELKVKMVEQINADRRAAGLGAVQYSEALSAAADAHCFDMLRGKYASHWNQEGWKPYVRYAQAGIQDTTAENLYSLRQTNFAASQEEVWQAMENGHRSFMEEKAPNDGHRRSILEPRHQRVGIGLAFDSSGLRMIEVFGERFADLKPLPFLAKLKDRLYVEGLMQSRVYSLSAVSVYYEPLPAKMSRLELQQTGAYGLPEEEEVERPKREGRIYVDGSTGTVSVDDTGRFWAPLRFWKGQPGIYTVVVWLQGKGDKAFVGVQTSVMVE